LAGNSAFSRRLCYTEGAQQSDAAPYAPYNDKGAGKLRDLTTNPAA